MTDLSKFRIEADKAVLTVIDIQERLVTAMPQEAYRRMRETTSMLLQAAELLDLPLVTTEQYPRGIGHTVTELAGACRRGRVIEKVSFGCCGEPAFMKALGETGRTQVIVAGMEAHVCVYQTVLGLLEAGYHVHLASDATCSRNLLDERAGLQNARDAGAVVTTAEMALFQMMRESTHEQFRAVSKLIKARS